MRGERTHAWLHLQKHLRMRDEQRDDVHFAFLALSGCLIFFRNLKPYFCEGLIARRASSNSASLKRVLSAERVRSEADYA
ncbi:Isjp4 transposase [Stigmatella aurantiaca DW4/3-1]|uniref:Transposase n=1 Tax=Stigmatella aurantiaca (strain DW4/3-1) TaxID=378806 RepID=Q094J2_STIAD|nr:Isjp4 transposase [Stigmatella aurantiaca DW4/3-1]EAU67145.1 transposase [Stigmatella aurantiaca DW4/3-1]